MKHVLITGGNDGIGKAAAQKLVEAGFAVTILGRNEEKLQAAARETNSEFVVADVADYEQVVGAIENATQKNGPVDILINSAGVWLQGPLDGSSPTEIKQVIDANVTGVINCSKAVVPQMKARSHGRIINISSQAGLYASAEKSVYNASKWAVTGFTKALAAELKPFGIGVTGYYPGAVNTKLFEKAGNDKGLDNAVDPYVLADTLVYICSLPDNVTIPEFGIQDLRYK